MAQSKSKSIPFYYSWCTMWRKWRSSITAGFFRTRFLFIKRGCCRTCRFRTIFQRRFGREASSCWKRVRAAIRTDRSRWSFWLARRRSRAFTWMWGSPWRKFSAIIRWMKGLREFNSQSRNCLMPWNILGLLKQTPRLTEAFPSNSRRFLKSLSDLIRLESEYQWMGNSSANILTKLA